MVNYGENKKALSISSDEVAVKKMLELAKKLKLKVMVAIDEISNSKSLREFCAFFNVCKGQGCNDVGQFQQIQGASATASHFKMPRQYVFEICTSKVRRIR